jgi:hypothetical protein
MSLTQAFGLRMSTSEKYDKTPLGSGSSNN